MKVYGEGEWKVRQHGWSKRRTWRKLHIGMDPSSGEVITCELTNNSIGSGDAENGKKMVEKLPKCIEKVYGDGAYDAIDFRRALDTLGAQAIIPPPKNAILYPNKFKHRFSAAPKQRNSPIISDPILLILDHL